MQVGYVEIRQMKSEKRATIYPNSGVLLHPEARKSHASRIKPPHSGQKASANPLQVMSNAVASRRLEALCRRALRAAIPRRGIGTVPISLREMVEERRLKALRHLALRAAIPRRGIGTVRISLREMVEGHRLEVLRRLEARRNLAVCSLNRPEWYPCVAASRDAAKTDTRHPSALHSRGSARCTSGATGIVLHS
jgi:hypothetical protein